MNVGQPPCLELAVDQGYQGTDSGPLSFLYVTLSDWRPKTTLAEMNTASLPQKAGNRALTPRSTVRVCVPFGIADWP